MKNHGYEGEEYKIDLVKMPHHGSDSEADTLNLFLRTFMPDYAVISVGANQYKHPSTNTLKLLDSEGARYYRTDKNGDILVRSDSKTLSVETQR